MICYRLTLNSKLNTLAGVWRTVAACLSDFHYLHTDSATPAGRMPGLHSRSARPSSCGRTDSLTEAETLDRAPDHGALLSVCPGRRSSAWAGLYNNGYIIWCLAAMQKLWFHNMMGEDDIQAPPLCFISPHRCCLIVLIWNVITPKKGENVTYKGKLHSFTLRNKHEFNMNPVKASGLWIIRIRGTKRERFAICKTLLLINSLPVSALGLSYLLHLPLLPRWWPQWLCLQHSRTSAFITDKQLYKQEMLHSYIKWVFLL